MEGNITVDAVTCSWQLGCGNATRNPSGLCHIHEGKTAPNADAHVDGLKISLSMEQQSNWTSHISPREEQIEMASSIMDELYTNDQDRCQIRAACGMGKTLVQQMVISEMNEKLLNDEGRNGVFIVMAPSIKLARQLRDDYISDGVIDMGISEGDLPTDGEGKRKNAADVKIASMLSVHDQSVDMNKHSPDKEMLDEQEVARFLQNEDTDGPRIIFAVTTSQSVDKIIRAQRKLGIEVDGVIFDEAHNLAGSLGSAKKGDDSTEILRVFKNEDPRGLNARKRVFMTATTRGGQSQIHGAFGSSSERYLAALRTKDAGGKIDSDGVPVYQNDMDMFGKTVKSYNFRYAIDKGYLVQPEFHTERSYILTRKGEALGRSSMVNYAGTTMTPSPQLTLGTYQTIASSITALAQDNPNGGPRNLLAFVSTINEADAVSAREHWKGVADAMSSATLGAGSRPLSVTEAKMIMGNDGFTPEQRLAAKYTLIGEYAAVTSTSSKQSASQQQQAEGWFDSKRPGDREPCKCGQIGGGWCACSRVVSNVDMLSEGVNMPSVDTVVMNRPDRSAESAVYQSIGRSSRLWRDRVTGEDFKTSARVIVPTVHTMYDQDGVLVEGGPAIAKDARTTVRRVTKIMRDAGTEEWRRPGDEDATFIDNYDGEVSGFAFAEGDRNGMTVTEALLLNKMWDAAESNARADYDAVHGSRAFSQLSPQERFDTVKARVQTYGSNARENSDAILALKQVNVSPSDVQMAQSYSADLQYRFEVKEVVDTEENEARVMMTRKVTFRGNRALSDALKGLMAR